MRLLSRRIDKHMTTPRTQLQTAFRLLLRSSVAAGAIVFSIIGTACQSEYNTVLNPLGPIPGSKAVLFYPQVSASSSTAYHQGQGALVVLTPTGMAYAGSTMYFPHLSYLIKSENGWPLRSVTNHGGRTDELPHGVPLAAGRYTLIAEADGLGEVKVPIQINSGMVTKVVLQRFRGENDIW